MQDEEVAKRLAEKVQHQGGRAYLVGGAVRDRLMGNDGKDIDIEIHGISQEALERILDQLGERLHMGKSFGIYSLRGSKLDIALCEGKGVMEQELREAAKRRDLTINAMMMDILTGEILDFFGGREDLERGILRHTCEETFSEDPLRVFRVARFSARLGFAIAKETMDLCRKTDLRGIAKERVRTELEYALLKTPRPSIFLERLREMDQLDAWFPELKALIGIKQPVRYHAEGDAWIHTLRVVDAAALYRECVKNPWALMLAAMLHDVGKAICTTEVDGVIHAYGHDQAGVPIATQFIQRITDEKNVIEIVRNLVADHMKPNVVAGVRAVVKTTNRMFDRSKDPEALIALALADGQGSMGEKSGEDNEPFLRERLECYRACMEKPCVMGEDLIGAGLVPNKDFSELLAYAHKLHLAGVPKEKALKQTLAYERTFKRDKSCP